MITADQLRLLMAYDQKSGVMTWLVRTSNRVKIGDVVGSSHVQGYREVGVNGRSYLLHRLVWLHVHGSWPSSHIDHVNGDRTDNRIMNLREATRSQNLSNRRATRLNTSGYKGVTWERRRKKWQAQITVRRKLKFLGYFDCVKKAHDAYWKAAQELHGEFANFG